jgi:hypothetical protein
MGVGVVNNAVGATRQHWTVRTMHLTAAGRGHKPVM